LSFSRSQTGCAPRPAQVLPCFVAVFDRDLSALHGASATPLARGDLAAQSGQLILQFTCPAAERLSHIIAELSKEHRQTLNQDLFWPFLSPQADSHF
jgi:hypothetical protein